MSAGEPAGGGGARRVASRNRVLLTADRGVSRDFLDRVQWAAFRALGRPVVIAEPLQGGKDGEWRAENEDALLARVREDLAGLALDHTDAIVVAMNNGFCDGGIAVIGDFVPGVKLLLVPLLHFSGAAAAVRAVLHTLGHSYGLVCCHDAGCVMSHWNDDAGGTEDSEDARFCDTCRNRLADA